MATSDLLSVTAVAERLSCSRGHVYNLIAAGDLPVVEIGTTGAKRAKSRVLVADLDAFIAARERRAGRAPRLSVAT